jgi:hypothetical protein
LVLTPVGRCFLGIKKRLLAAGPTADGEPRTKARSDLSHVALCRRRSSAMSSGRISWLRRVRLESPLGHGDILSGLELKLSGERDGRLGLARFSAVCPLSGHACKWPFVARRYGRCCMYGPNYAELGRGRVFAVQLFSMIKWLLSTIPRCPRSDPTPIGPTAMPSSPPFASPSPIHFNTHCSRLKPRQWQPRHV